MDNKAGVVYQFTVLAAIILLNGYILYTTGTLNETLTGALIGVMLGLPFKKE